MELGHQTLQIDLNCEVHDEIEDEIEVAVSQIDLNKDGCENKENSNNQLPLVEYNDEFVTEYEISKGSKPPDDVAGCLRGECRDTLDEILELYCQHAAFHGFGVRKDKNRYSFKEGTGVLTGKYFVCSAAGERKVDKKKTEPKEQDFTKESSYLEMKVQRTRRVIISRTGCGALIYAKLNENGQFEIVQHIMEHNHELTRAPLTYLHRSERQMTDSKLQAIEAMAECGLRPMESFRYMATEAGGEDCLGHTVKDHLNYCYKLKMKAIDGKDAQTVVDKLNEEQANDPEFFFRVRLDNEGKVCCLYWRDSMMFDDYKIYGDVLVFDTTFRTNKYNLICAPFVGINNHWANSMFACSFIGDETTESFVWLFETFKKSMGGKCPITIFTDQDAAIAAGILQVFPNSRHRLCLWHLSQNANNKMGVLKADKKFKRCFHKCLSGCITTDEFEKEWSSMITTYKLEQDQWFARLYTIKEKWCTAYSKDFFSAGILSSQRSESTNHAVGLNATKNTTLTEFLSIFRATVNRWRRTEEQAEFDCTRGIPSSDLCISALLKHAALVYTHTLFRDFEEEFKYAIASDAAPVRTEGTTLIYEVCIEGIPGSNQQVAYDYKASKIQCSCKNFEESGWLCFHCLKIFNFHGVKKIPDQYISKRWTRMAKQEIWEKLDLEKKQKGEINHFTPWRLHMIRRYYNLILKSHNIQAARKVIENNFMKTNILVEKILKAEAEKEAAKEAAAKSQEQNGEKLEESSSSSTITVLDPDRAVTKGRDNKRIKGHYDLYKQPSKKGKQRHKEFGTKTPKIQLF